MVRCVQELPITHEDFDADLDQVVASSSGLLMLTGQLLAFPPGLITSMHVKTYEAGPKGGSVPYRVHGA